MSNSPLLPLNSSPLVPARSGSLAPLPLPVSSTWESLLHSLDPGRPEPARLTAAALPVRTQRLFQAAFLYSSVPRLQHLASWLRYLTLVVPLSQIISISTQLRSAGTGSALSALMRSLGYIFLVVIYFLCVRFMQPWASVRTPNKRGVLPAKQAATARITFSACALEGVHCEQLYFSDVLHSPFAARVMRWLERTRWLERIFITGAASSLLTNIIINTVRDMPVWNHVLVYCIIVFAWPLQLGFACMVALIAQLCAVALEEVAHVETRIMELLHADSGDTDSPIRDIQRLLRAGEIQLERISLTLRPFFIACISFNLWVLVTALISSIWPHESSAGVSALDAFYWSLSGIIFSACAVTLACAVPVYVRFRAMCKRVQRADLQGAWSESQLTTLVLLLESSQLYIKCLGIPMDTTLLVRSAIAISSTAIVGVARLLNL